MGKSRKFLLCLMLFTSLFTAQIFSLSAVEAAQKLYSPAELKQDIDFLFKTMEEVHPNLYAYTSKAIMEQKRKEVESQITAPMSGIDFYVKIAPLVTSLKEGHTRIKPFLAEYKQYINKSGLLFPFDLDFEGDKAFIAANYSADTDIPLNSELLSINGIPINSISKNLMQFVSGEKESFKNKILGFRFRVMFWIAYEFEQTYNIEFIPPLKDKICKASVAGVSQAVIDKKNKIVSEKEKPVYYSYYSLPDEKIGIIDFLSFSGLDQFKKFLQEAFSKIQKDQIKILIIDIRKNGGGNSVLGNELLGYITDKPFTQYSRVEIKISKQIKDSLKSSYIDALADGSTYVSIGKPESTGENPLRFKGKVYVFISPNTFSSATDFAATVKDYKLGILVGEETGGLATSYGDVYSFSLPNTGIAVDVSYKYFVRPSGKNDKQGVLPDYKIKENLQDKISGVDRTVEFIRETVKKEPL